MRRRWRPPDPGCRQSKSGSRARIRAPLRPSQRQRLPSTPTHWRQPQRRGGCASARIIVTSRDQGVPASMASILCLNAVLLLFV